MIVGSIPNDNVQTFSLLIAELDSEYMDIGLCVNKSIKYGSVKILRKITNMYSPDITFDNISRASNHTHITIFLHKYLLESIKFCYIHPIRSNIS